MLGGIELKSQLKLADVELLQQLHWRSGADSKARRKAAAKGDKTAFVLASRAALQNSADRLQARLGEDHLAPLSGEQTPADSLAACFVSGHESEARNHGEVIRQWLHAQPLTAGSVPSCDVMLMLQLLLTPPHDTQLETWLRLWRLALINVAAPPAKSKEKTLSIKSIASAEIRFAGGLVFGALEGSDSLRDDARKTLNSALLELTDTDGMPAARVAENIRTWLATFARTAIWGKAFKTKVFDTETGDRYKLLVRRAVEMSSIDRFAFETRASETKGLLRLAAKTAGWSSKTTTGALARGRTPKAKKRGSQGDVPAVQSDWAEFAYCRSDRSIGADVLAVGHDGSTPNISLNCLGAGVLSGAWQTTLTIGDKPLIATGRWDCSCWHSDKDGDYIELQWSRNRYRIDRQIFLSRTQHFAVLMDSVTGKRDTQLGVAMTLPLVADVMARADFVSREWRLHTGDTAIRAFPVSLDFDRVHHALGDFGVEQNQLRYSVTGQQATQAALVLDWHPKRKTDDTDWQPLTVTEDRQALTSAQAAAFRLRVGKHQLVSYRNLDGSEALRAVMGNHSDHETVIGRFGKNGLEPLVLVDQ